MATLEQIATALQKAAAAGNTDDAQQLAHAYAAMRGQSGQQDVQQLSNAYYADETAGNHEKAVQDFRNIRAQGGHLAPPSQEQTHALNMSPQYNPTTHQNGVQTFEEGLGRSVYQTGRGIGQLLGLNSQQDINDAQQLDEPLMHTTGGKIGNVAGQMAQMATPVGDIAKPLEYAGKAAPFLKAAIGAGAFSGAQPVYDGESRAWNAVKGAAAGAAGQGVSGALGAAAKATKPFLSKATQEGIQVLRDAGVPLHFSQLTDSKGAKTLASAAGYLPFAGNAAAKRAQQQAFNQALSKTIGQDAKELTPDVMKKAANVISNKYNALFGRNAVNIDPEDVSKLVNIAAKADTDLLPEQAQVVKNQIAKYVNAAGKNGGEIPGRLYQNIRETLKPLEKDGGGHLIGEVRKTMQDAANKSFKGGDAKKLAELNGQFSNRKILERALKRVDGADNNVHPARLWSLVNGKYGSTPEMEALARAGQNVLKDPIPDSGTASRNVIYSLMGLGGALHPASLGTIASGAAAGATVGRALNSELAAKLLPGSTSRTLSGLSRLSAPARYVLPAAVNGQK